MNRRILIVEDDVAFGTMLQKWFQKNGWNPTLVSKIEQAVNELNVSVFDMIIPIIESSGIISLTLGSIALYSSRCVMYWLKPGPSFEKTISILSVYLQKAAA